MNTATTIRRHSPERELSDALREILLKAVRQQASGGDLYDFQDCLRECADIARAAINKATGK